MKKVIRILIGVLALGIIGFCYYYVTLPAINIHASGFWFSLMFLIFVVMGIVIVGKKQFEIPVEDFLPSVAKLKTIRVLGVLLVVVFLVYIGGSILSSPIVSADQYQQLLTVEERNFTEDITEADYQTIPLLDKDSATILGDRKMGSLVEMVSQFEVSSNYTQINYNDMPVRVSPLVYASPIKWFTNQSEGIPAYILIDMATQDTECVILEEGIRYSESEYFNRYIYRHLRFNYPTYIFDDQIFFEIDDEGVPYWVAPVKKFNIGLFGGQTVGRVVLCNAITGECVDYAVEDVPQWVDKVFSAELLTELYDYHGIYKNGFFNSILSQRDCLTTTNGYNYIALDDDVWVYTGVTSVSGDQSNVGFVLMNQRTMETRYYTVEGAIEDSAMSSAEGQVQNLGYDATFPLLLNISNEPTYFMALKDDAGLVKQYAMVNVQKYQWVATGDTIQACEANYIQLLNTNGIVSEDVDTYQTINGEIISISPIVFGGTTHYYVLIEGSDDIFDIDMSDDSLIGIIKYEVGDVISVSYMVGEGLHGVRSINE